MRDLKLSPEYSSSHALVIGINNYQHVSRLSRAAADAQAIADMMRSSFSFPQENIKLLVDQQATKKAILEAYFDFEKSTNLDSRLLVFFAGHGETKTGANGEVGFLVPHDGDVTNLSTLLRWDDLVRNADLIHAKHIFFVMDACYGGLVFKRSVSAGSVRFLKDMIIRPVRQALTAGKEDELVSDGGGPRPNTQFLPGIS